MDSHCAIKADTIQQTFCSSNNPVTHIYMAHHLCCGWRLESRGGEGRGGGKGTEGEKTHLSVKSALASKEEMNHDIPNMLGSSSPNTPPLFPHPSPLPSPPPPYVPGLRRSTTVPPPPVNPFTAWNCIQRVVRHDVLYTYTRISSYILNHCRVLQQYVRLLTCFVNISGNGIM